MERKTTYNVSTITEKKYQDILKTSFGLGITNRVAIMGELGLKTMKVKNKMLMARILESVKWCDNVGADFRDEKLRERKELNQVNLLRSVRFLNGLPCHGQRTQTNAGTSKRRVGKKHIGNMMRKKQSWRLRVLSRRRRGEGGLKSNRRISRIKFLLRVRNSMKQRLVGRLIKKAYYHFNFFTVPVRFVDYKVCYYP